MMAKESTTVDSKANGQSFGDSDQHQMRKKLKDTKLDGAETEQQVDDLIADKPLLNESGISSQPPAPLDGKGSKRMLDEDQVGNVPSDTIPANSTTIPAPSTSSSTAATKPKPFGFQASVGASSPFASFASSSSPFATAGSKASAFVKPSFNNKNNNNNDTEKTPASSSFGNLIKDNPKVDTSPKKRAKTHTDDENDKEQKEEAEDTTNNEAESQTSKEEKSDKTSFARLLERKDERDGKEVEKKDETVEYQAQDVHTGEEEESTVFTVRAKLYIVDSETKAWKERGTGVVRVNTPVEGEGNPRLVMRADGVFRVILNVPLFKGMQVEGGERAESGISNDKFIKLVVLENGHPVPIAVKLASPSAARDLATHIKDVIAKK